MLGIGLTHGGVTPLQRWIYASGYSLNDLVYVSGLMNTLVNSTLPAAGF